MKRYMIVILMVVMSFSLSACNTDEKDKDIVNDIVCNENETLVGEDCVPNVTLECEDGTSILGDICVDDKIINFRNSLSDFGDVYANVTTNYTIDDTTIVRIEKVSGALEDSYVYTASFKSYAFTTTYILLVSYDGNIEGFEVLENGEHESFGGLLSSPEFKDNVIGLTYEEGIESSFDGIAGSTMTSDRFKDSLTKVLGFHKLIILEIEPVIVDPEVYCDVADTDCIEIIEELLATMTIAAKAAQMVQAERGSITLQEVKEFGIGSILSGGGSHPSDYTNSADVWYNMYSSFQNKALESEFGIPLIYGIDAVHGNNNLYGATIFPHNIGLGAANDPELMFRIGEAVTRETKVTGINWNFAPALSVVQNIRWGRTYEGFSENPEIHMNLTYQTIMGMQQLGFSATAKHFFGDGGTFNGIDQGNTTGNEAELRALHLLPYYEAIRADVDTIMITYSSINGEKMHGFDYWINDVLKDEMGFEGFIISDWNAVDQIQGQTKYEKVVNSVNAGVDMLMEPNDWRNVINHIINGVNNEDISIERMDDAVRRILQIKYKNGLFDNPLDRLSVEDNLYTQEHQDLAREAARKSLVLLKNTNDVLPLAKGENIYITGPGADHIGLMSGGWTTWWQGNSDDLFIVGTSIKDALHDVLTVNGAGITSEYSNANTVVIVLAETPYAEGVGDTNNPSLTTGNAHAENAAALQLAATAKADGKVVIGILLSGRPLILGDHINHFDGFIAAWLPGSEGGLAISDVLFGDYDFTGKLPFTWPKDVSQLGYNSNDENYDPNSVMYPYGYGLSYLE